VAGQAQERLNAHQRRLRARAFRACQSAFTAIVVGLGRGRSGAPNHYQKAEAVIGPWPFGDRFHTRAASTAMYFSMCTSGFRDTETEPQGNVPQVSEHR
jgi:hypothetical protein